MGWGDIATNGKIEEDGICRCHGLWSPIRSPSGDFAKVLPITNSLTGEIDYTPCIYSRLKVWLGTKKGERPIHPQFGCCIRDYISQPLTYAKLQALKGDVERELTALFPEEGFKVSNVMVTVPARNSVKVSANIGNTPVQFLGNAADIDKLQVALNRALVDLGMKRPY